MFYIQRPPVPNQHCQIARWLTRRGGWTTNFAFAKPFPSRIDAEIYGVRGRENFGLITAVGIDTSLTLNSKQKRKR